MTYRFLLNGHVIDKEERDAKIFAASIPADTPVLVFGKNELIDKGCVCDIWDLPNESYQKKLNRKIHKK
jgi:hypothetical protein